MKSRLFAFVCVAALGASVIHAKADNPPALRSTVNDFKINSTSDAPSGSYAGGESHAASSSITWDARIRLGAGMVYDSSTFVVTPASGNTPAVINTVGRSVDLRLSSHLGATLRTTIPVGDVGIYFAVQGSGDSNNTFIANGSNFAARTDGVYAWWKLDPNFTITAGQVAGIATNYSWDSNANNWMFGLTGGGILGFKNSPDDAVGARFGYNDGSFDFAAQVADSNNANGVSAFGTMFRAGYKYSGFGVDVGGSYLGDAVGPANTWSAWSGFGYGGSAFSAGVSAGVGAFQATNLNRLPVSVFSKVKMFDIAELQAGLTHDFLAPGTPTTFGAGAYLYPYKQLSFGLEGGYVMNSLGPAGGDGSYSVGVVSQFAF